jgi:hypothetical protein
VVIGVVQPGLLIPTMATRPKTTRTGGLLSGRPASAPGDQGAGQASAPAIPSFPPTEPTAAAVNQAAIETMAAGVDAIRAQIASIQAGTGGDSRHDAGSRIAFLAAKAGSIYEATRKAEAARQKRLEAMSPAMVLAWYRGLAQADREHIMRELLNVDSRRSGLG